MQQTVTVAPAERCGALASLFVRYVTGQIGESTWASFSHCVDGIRRVSREEREALAAFLNDVSSELGPEMVRVPGIEEAEEVLQHVRHA